MNVQKKASVALLAALMALPMAAQDALKISVKELPSRPFIVNDTSVTITELSGYKIFDSQKKFSGRGRVALTLENKSTKFMKFDPQDLCFVGKDGTQVFPVFERNLADDTMPMTLRLVPGSHASTEYALTGRLTFPARIYLNETLVAVVE